MHPVVCNVASAISSGDEQRRVVGTDHGGDVCTKEAFKKCWSGSFRTALPAKVKPALARPLSHETCSFRVVSA